MTTAMNYDEILNEIKQTIPRFFELKKNGSAYRATLKEQCALADRLHAFLAEERGIPDSRLMDRILDDTDWLASDWLLDLPLDLGRFGLVDEAAHISRQYADLFEAANFLGDLAVILAEGGRREEALKQIDENLERFPQDAWVTIKVGDALEALNEDDRAIELLYRTYSMTEPLSYDRDGVLERLVPLLREKQRNDEAGALVEKEREIRKPVLPAKTGKIGRNKLCPCDSGKKYKKCCLGKEL